jgi:polynucleotide 5'-kinase involved in rRNA processing
MLNHFEEINHFFSTPHFNDRQLNELKIAVAQKYKDKKMLQAALASIELYILKYNITEDVKPEKVKPLVNPVKLSTVPLRMSRKQFKERQMVKWLSFLTLEELREVLEVSKSMFERLLKRNNIPVHETKRLSEEDFEKLIDFIITKYKSILRKGKMLKQILEPIVVRTKKPEEHNAIRVYDAIATYGLGKVIYIRKK